MSMKVLPKASHWAAKSWERPWGSAAKTTSLCSTTWSWVPQTKSIIWL